MRKCKTLVENVIKNNRRKWLIKSIKELEKIENKTSLEEYNLCSKYNTLMWIPFEKGNEINKLCNECEYNKYRNLEI